MTLDQFLAQLKKETVKFEKNWRRENRRLPDRWPMEMNETDWYEQFMTFITNEPSEGG